jgi:hypothetical protein
MSNVLLFVYPDKGYFDKKAADAAYCWGSSRAVPYVLSLYDHLIDVRYRRHGYEVFWLIHGQDTDPAKPDQTRISSWVTIGLSDKVISSGITWADLNVSNERADGKFVLSQLPQDIDRLVVVGFHERDCVDKVARYVYEQTAIDVMVDIDLCHMLPRRLACREAVPDHRLRFDPLGYDPLDDEQLETVVSNWIEKPWRRQRRMYELTSEEFEAAKRPIKTTVELFGRTSSVGVWEGTPKSYAYWLTSPDRTNSYGKVMALNGHILALDYNAIPADATPEEADNFVILAEFESEASAASWLEHRTARSPRVPFERVPFRVRSSK